MAFAGKTSRAMDAENENPSLNTSKVSQSESFGSSKPPRSNSQRERTTSRNDLEKARNTPKKKSALSTPVKSTPNRNASKTPITSSYKGNSQLFNVTFPPGSMGIEFQSSSGRGYGCVIHRMKPNNYTQLQPGDHVVNIDGIGVHGWTFSAIIEELRKNQHHDRVVTFERALRGGVSSTPTATSVMLSALKGLPPTPVSATHSVGSPSMLHRDHLSLPPTPIFEPSVAGGSVNGEKEDLLEIEDKYDDSNKETSMLAATNQNTSTEENVSDSMVNTPTTVEEPNSHHNHHRRGQNSNDKLPSRCDSGVKNLDSTLAKTVVLTSPVETPGGGKMYCLSDGFKVHIPMHGACQEEEDNEEEEVASARAQPDQTKSLKKAHEVSAKKSETKSSMNSAQQINRFGASPFAASFTSRDADGNESEISAITTSPPRSSSNRKSSKKKSSKSKSSKLNKEAVNSMMPDHLEQAHIDHDEEVPDHDAKISRKQNKLTVSALKEKNKADEKMIDASVSTGGRKVSTKELFPSSKTVLVENMNRNASLNVHTTYMDDSISLSQATSPVEGNSSVWSGGGFGSPNKAKKMSSDDNNTKHDSSAMDGSAPSQHRSSPRKDPRSRSSTATAAAKSNTSLRSTSPMQPSSSYRSQSKRRSSSPRVDRAAIQRAKDLSSSLLSRLEVTAEEAGDLSDAERRGVLGSGGGGSGGDMSSIKFEGSSLMKPHRKTAAESSVTWIDQTNEDGEEGDHDFGAAERSMMSEVSMTPSDIAVANAHKHADNIHYGREFSPEKTDMLVKSPYPNQSLTTRRMSSNALTPPQFPSPASSSLQSNFASPEKLAMTSAEWEATKEAVSKPLLSARRHTIKGLVHGAPSPESRGLMALEYEGREQSVSLIGNTMKNTAPVVSNRFLDAVTGSLRQAQQHTSALDVFTAARQRAGVLELSASDECTESSPVSSPRHEDYNCNEATSPIDESILLERQPDNSHSLPLSASTASAERTLVIPSSRQDSPQRCSGGGGGGAASGGGGESGGELYQPLTPLTPDRASSTPSTGESFASPFNHCPDSDDKDDRSAVSASAWFIDQSPARLYNPALARQAEQQSQHHDHAVVATAVSSASRVVTASATRTVFAKVLESAASPMRNNTRPIQVVRGQRTFAEEAAEAISNELQVKSDALLKAQENVRRLQAENDERGQKLVKALDDREKLLEALVGAEESGEYKFKLLKQSSEEKEMQLKQQLEDAQEEVEKLKEEINECKRDNSNIEELDKENIELEANLLESRVECDSLRNVIENERKEHSKALLKVKEASQHLVKSLQEEKKQLEAELLDAESQMTNFQEKMESERAEYTASLSKSQVDMHALVEKLEGEKKNLELALLEARSGTASIQTALEQERKEHTSMLSASQLETRAKFDELELEKKQLEASLKDSRADIDALQNMFESESVERGAAAEQQRCALQEALAKVEALDLTCRKFEIDAMNAKDQAIEAKRDIEDLQAECSRLFKCCAEKDKEVESIRQKAEKAALDHINQLEDIRRMQEAQREKQREVLEAASNCKQARMNSSPALLTSSPMSRHSFQGSISPVPSMSSPSFLQSPTTKVASRINFSSPTERSLPLKPPPLWSPEPTLKPSADTLCVSAVKSGGLQLCEGITEMSSQDGVSISSEEGEDRSNNEDVMSASFEDEVKCRMEALVMEINTYKDEMENMTTRNSLLESKYEESQVSLKSITLELDNLKANLNEEINAKKCLESSMVDLQVTLMAKEVEIANSSSYSQSQIDALEENVKVLEQKFQVGEEKVKSATILCDRLNDRVEVLQSEAVKSTDTIYHLEQELQKAKLAVQNECFADENAKLKIDIEKLKSEGEQSVIFMNQLKQELEETKLKQSMSSIECEKLKADIETLQLEIEESNGNAEQLQKEVEELESKHAEKAALCEKLESDIEMLQNEVEELSGNNEQLEDEIEESSLRHKESVEFCEKLQAEIDTLNAEMDEQEEQLQTFKALCAKQEEDIEAMDKAASVYEQIGEDHQNCMQATKSLNEKLEAEIDEANGLSEELASQLEEMQNSNRHLEAKLDAEIKLKLELETKLEETIKLNEILKSRVEELESKMEVCLEEKEAVDGQLLELGLEIDTMKKSKEKYEELSQVEMKYGEKITKLENDLETCISSKESLGEKASIAEKKVEELAEINEALSIEKLRVEEEFEEMELKLRKELSQLRKQLSEANEKMKNASASSSFNDGDTISSPKALLEAEEMTMQLKSQILELEQSLKAAQTEIMNLLAKNQMVEDKCSQMASLMESNIKESAQALRDQNSKVKSLEAKLRETEELSEARCDAERRNAEILQEEVEENQELLHEYKERVRIAERAAEQLARTAKDTAQMACEVETEAEQRREAITIELESFKERCSELEQQLSNDRDAQDNVHPFLETNAFSKTCGEYEAKIRDLEQQLQDTEEASFDNNSNDTANDTASMTELDRVDVGEEDLVLVSNLTHFREEVIAISTKVNPSESMPKQLAKSSEAIIEIVTKRLEDYKVKQAATKGKNQKKLDSTSRALTGNMPPNMSKKLTSSLNNLDNLHSKASSYVGMLSMLSSSSANELQGDESLSFDLSIAQDFLSPQKQGLSNSGLISPGFCLSPAAIDALAENSNSIVHASKSLITELGIAMNSVRKGASLSIKACVKYSHLKTVVVAFRRWETFAASVQVGDVGSMASLNRVKEHAAKIRNQAQSRHLSSTSTVRAILKGQGINQHSLKQPLFSPATQDMLRTEKTPTSTSSSSSSSSSPQSSSPSSSSSSNPSSVTKSPSPSEASSVGASPQELANRKVAALTGRHSKRSSASSRPTALAARQQRLAAQAAEQKQSPRNEDYLGVSSDEES